MDNEPEPFWTGWDHAARIEEWKKEVGWREAWGRAEPVKDLNGFSGRWVEDCVLRRLSTARSEAWITDCLDTYRVSVKMLSAIRDVYSPLASRFGLPSARLSPHPSEPEIVRETLSTQVDRLRNEIFTAKPGRVVTLGNAALRIFRQLIDEPRGPRRLSVERYGEELSVSMADMVISWLPLAHPAAPPIYQDAHKAWTP